MARTIAAVSIPIFIDCPPFGSCLLAVGFTSCRYRGCREAAYLRRSSASFRNCLGKTRCQIGGYSEFPGPGNQVRLFRRLGIAAPHVAELLLSVDFLEEHHSVVGSG